MKPSLTYDQIANKIAAYGWSDAATVPVTYGFRSSDPSDPGFARFSATLIGAADQAMALWADVANIAFQQVGSGTSGAGAYTDNATILFAGDTDSGGYGWTYFPGNRAAGSVDGNVYLNTSGGNFTNLANGSYEFMALLHEIGHAIGLAHPGAYNGGSPTYANDAEYLQDSRQYTVMSYFNAEETGAVHNWNFASTPLLHDIAAVQRLYGANMATRGGDTVYGFNSNADRAQFHITSAGQKVVFAIWDGGGNDTLDFSGYTQNGKINLNYEAFSDVGGLVANVAIARGAIIENAKGGAGNDILIGNGIANFLFGGAGTDDLKGGAGNDTLDGGSGSDTAEFSGASGDYTFWLATDGSVIAGDHVSGRDGYDIIFNVESGHFSNGTFGLASLISAGAPPDQSAWPASSQDPTAGISSGSGATGMRISGTNGSDVCLGGSGDDVLKGFAGRDSLRAGAGFDILIGGGGKDVLNGGADGDVFEFDRLGDSGASAAKRDVIVDFHRNLDVIDLFGIDANALRAGNQAFHFITGAPFHHAAGELHAVKQNNPGTQHDRTIVEGDVNGDGRADFQIELKGLISLHKSDFIL